MKAKYCSQCGNEINENWNFCQSCGAKIESTDKSTILYTEEKNTSSQDEFLQAENYYEVSQFEHSKMKNNTNLTSEKDITSDRLSQENNFETITILTIAFVIIMLIFIAIFDSPAALF